MSYIILKLKNKQFKNPTLNLIKFNTLSVQMVRIFKNEHIQINDSEKNKFKKKLDQFIIINKTYSKAFNASHL